MRRSAVIACLVLLAGCGGGDISEEFGQARDRADRLREDIAQQVDAARDEFRRRRERFGDRIDEVLAQLEPIFEAPERTSPTVRARGRTGTTTIDAFLTDLLRDIDGHWTRVFAQAGLPEPRVSYNWIPPGGVTITGCGSPADDSVALYCPADDTIYVGQQFAADLYEGVLRGLPGESAGYGQARGDFAVAYVLAHEYAHNLQQELGVFDNSVSPSARPFELQADCMAGVWAYSVFAKGDLQAGDIEEATNAALAVGDFDVGNEQHHGTPEERREALVAGFDSGDPAVCRRYLPLS